eukprot:RCo019121
MESGTSLPFPAYPEGDPFLKLTGELLTEKKLRSSAVEEATAARRQLGEICAMYNDLVRCSPAAASFCTRDPCFPSVRVADLERLLSKSTELLESMKELSWASEKEEVSSASRSLSTGIRVLEDLIQNYSLGVELFACSLSDYLRNTMNVRSLLGPGDTSLEFSADQGLTPSAGDGSTLPLPSVDSVDHGCSDSRWQAEKFYLKELVRTLSTASRYWEDRCHEWERSHPPEAPLTQYLSSGKDIDSVTTQTELIPQLRRVLGSVDAENCVLLTENIRLLKEKSQLGALVANQASSISALTELLGAQPRETLFRPTLPEMKVLEQRDVTDSFQHFQNALTDTRAQQLLQSEEIARLQQQLAGMRASLQQTQQVAEEWEAVFRVASREREECSEQCLKLRSELLRGVGLLGNSPRSEAQGSPREAIAERFSAECVTASHGRDDFGEKPGLPMKVSELLKVLQRQAERLQELPKLRAEISCLECQLASLQQSKGGDFCPPVETRPRFTTETLQTDYDLQAFCLRENAARAEIEKGQIEGVLFLTRFQEALL